MKNNCKYRICILLLFAGWMTCLPSWPQYIQNGSLEGPPGDEFPPDLWFSDDSYSDPDLLGSYTTPTSYTTYFPADGTNFALFRARGVNYAESWHGPRQREYLYQELSIPLEKNTCFRIDAYLCTNPDYSVTDTENPNVAFPLKFQVWASNRRNGRDFLLVDSEPIRNTEWYDYSFYFSTQDTAYSYLLIESQWDTINVMPKPYCGMILIDNLRLTRIGDAQGTHNEYTLYYHGNYRDTLVAPDAMAYQWFPANVVSDPNNQSVVMQTYTETISVEIKPWDDCPYLDIYHVILDCDTLFSQDTNRIVNHYYRYEEDIVLEASEGIAYDWEPEVNLTAYDIRAPHLTAFHDHYSVAITSEYNCFFHEYFNIILHCDTLYPEKTITVLDTLLAPGSSIQLIPRHGWPDDTWQPSRYLSCIDCESPISTPQSSVSYSVALTDDYNCEHNEVFNIRIDLRIPNTITPNSDGFNDCLMIYGLPEGSSLKVFDKQGVLVYSRDPYNPDDCWFGFDQQGQPLRADTYWYAIDNPELGTISTGFIFLKR
ncbi:MAG: gliding motility-associated C-terminal domain-containing protein [Bacteroidales bacterium]|nr:gliding motility-associated C-terminal domain-containing protein [Bacteroidales bacterium]